MAQVGTRVMQQRRLRAELRRIRERAGRTQKAAAESLGWSTSKIIRIETGAVAVSPSDVMALLHVYDVNDKPLADELVAITRDKNEMWWDAYRKYHSQQFFDFLDYENAAIRIRQYIGFVVPGLLQTEDYAMALTSGYTDSEDVTKRKVELRMRRQQRLAEEGGPHAWFVLDEAVLHRWIGGPQVMRNQLVQLKEIARRPNVTIQVVPFKTGMHPGMIGSFTIFEFPSDGEDYDCVVNIEDPHREVLIRDDPETASKYVETFYELENFAVGKDQLDAVIDPVIETMRRQT
jgi:transcriptional regulator with XRE-family HTH domain